jgi:hypothetical protein
MVSDLENLQKEVFLVYGYVEDIAILVSGNFFNILRDLMIKALNNSTDMAIDQRPNGKSIED